MLVSSMTLEISLNPPFSFPRMMHTQKGESPRREAAHWVGPRQDQAREKSDNQKNATPTQKKDQRGYRPLSDITIGEVNDVVQSYNPQLVPAPLNGWIRKNYFCLVHLKTINRTRPSAIFGRVKSCYPAESHADNIQEVELYIPRRDGSPDIVPLYPGDINYDAPTPVQSYCLRLQLLFTDDELAEFEGSIEGFAGRGFLPQQDLDLMNLLDMTEENHQSYPWLYVIGSRWCADIPDSMYEDVKWKLDKMLAWGMQIVNYHPDWLSKEINPLNKILGYKYKLTRNFLTEPENPDQTARVLASTFNENFLQKRTE